MPFVIVDSDILIDYSRGDEIAADWLDTTASVSRLAISAVTEMELIVGSRNKTHLKELRKLLERFQILHINEEISVGATELVQEYFLSHGLLIADALIAATALYYNEPVSTKNHRDFRFILVWV